MSYEPTQWNDGDVITAEKMNKLEQGVQNEQEGPDLAHLLHQWMGTQEYHQLPWKHPAQIQQKSSILLSRI